MIQTWMADVTTLHDEKRYREYYREVPDFRKQKADRLQRQEDKALSVGAWMLFEKMREEYGLPEDALYNLSHSGEYVLCSVEDQHVATRKLGCDLERISEPRLQVANRFFCESEYESVLACPAESQANQFYRLWVLKESFLKATRQGMKLDMKSFEIGFEEGDKPYLRRRPEEYPETYVFREYAEPGVPYRIAVCADTECFASEVRVVEL